MPNLAFIQNILSFKQTSNKSTYALELMPHPELRRFQEVEVELILYPYRNLYAPAAGIHIQPYDSYLEDLTQNQKTLYSMLQSYGANIFGILLGAAITLVYWLFNQGELFGLQSIVAVIGVYLVGKEIWSDLEQWLIDLTENWRLRYYPKEYSFQLKSETTLDKYAGFARSRKYRRELVLADRLDMIRRSNSRDLKLLFPARKLVNIKDPEHPALRLAVVSFNEEALRDYEEDKFLVAVKLSLNRNILFFSFNQEWFQSDAGGETGCLDARGKWSKDAAFRRRALLIGRIKLYLSARVVPDFRVLVAD